MIVVFPVDSLAWLKCCVMGACREASVRWGDTGLGFDESIVVGVAG